MCHSSCCFRTIPETSQARGAVLMTAGNRQSPSTAFRKRHRFRYSSCPDLIRASILLRKILAKQMDCRVKPGNDGLRSDLLDLTEFQFDRRGAAEDRHRDLHARARLVDFLDHTGER